jgi:hypothetical protein
MGQTKFTVDRVQTKLLETARNNHLDKLTQGITQETLRTEPISTFEEVWVQKESKLPISITIDKLFGT